MYLQSINDVNNFVFDEFKIKVSGKKLRIYRETESKIELHNKYSIKTDNDVYKVLRQVNETYGTYFSIYSMPIFLSDFDENDRLKQLLPYYGKDIFQIVGTLFDKDKIVL